jgi:hypothetical protein
MVLLQSPCEGELEEVMRFNKVWWDNFKLRVNRARFAKGDKKEVEPAVQ